MGVSFNLCNLCGDMVSECDGCYYQITIILVSGREYEVDIGCSDCLENEKVFKKIIRTYKEDGEEYEEEIFKVINERKTRIYDIACEIIE